MTKENSDNNKSVEVKEVDEEKEIAKKRTKKGLSFRKDFKKRREQSRCIGIDLGTANTIVYSNGGIVLREPSVVAVNSMTKEILAAGEEAKRMIGRTPASIVAINPLKGGVIADFDVASGMIEYFLKKACKKHSLSRVSVNICAPYGVTSVEKMAIRDSIINLGVNNVTLIEEPLAAAIGAGLNVAEPIGRMIVDIGGGTTETAIISLGGIVIGVSTRVGGNILDESIAAYVKKKYSLLIGERTAEKLKMEIGTVDKNREDTMEVRGRDLTKGLPASRIITSADVYEAIKGNIDDMVLDIKSTIEKCPPELVSDIITNGIMLTGGGALLHGMKELLEEETLVPVNLAEFPLDCVAIGTGMSCVDAYSDKKKTKV